MIPACCCSPCMKHASGVHMLRNEYASSSGVWTKAKRSPRAGLLMEGTLLKYTNVMKGWQPRWFMLDPSTGMLQYFEKEEHKGQKPRGCVYMAGAWVTACDDEERAFVVTSSGGQSYRLKAQDSDGRGKWVESMRSTAEQHCTSDMQFPAVVPRHMSIGSQMNLFHRKSAKEPGGGSTPDRSPSNAVVSSPVEQVEDYLEDALGYSRAMFSKINTLSFSPQGQKNEMTALDKDLLVMKATSRATLRCLSECLTMMKMTTPDGQTAGRGVEAEDLKKRYHRIASITGEDTGSIKTPPHLSIKNDSEQESEPDLDEEEADRENEEEEDPSVFMDCDMEVAEEHKSVILHLLSQLKLGMDLTKIALPTFILERRSLLEMFADFMAHPDLFLRIPEEPNAEKRMLLVLEWYLTSFHAGRQADVAKKPYNPIIGETFRCSWLIPWDQAASDGRGGGGGRSAGKKDMVRLVYRAEQVSHHPPVSAFYVECRDRNMCLNGSIWTKSRFLGMSVGVSMVGTVKLSLLDVKEDYTFGLPSAYCRSILSVPWVELGDRVCLSCPQTSLTANVTFHTKPFYGGKPHKVTADLKDTTSGKHLCKVSGEWNGVLEFSYADGTSKEVDVHSLKQWKKRVLPIAKQSEFESRRLWQHVTKALQLGDIRTATEHKWSLEERQRDGENHRKKTRTAFDTKYFHQEDENWVYNHLLCKNPSATSSAVSS